MRSRGRAFIFRQIAIVCLATLAGFGPALAQSDQGGLAFRSCWSVCGPSADGGDTRACEACLREICASQPRLSGHPACERVGVSARPSAPPEVRADDAPLTAPAPQRAPRSSDPEPVAEAPPEITTAQIETAAPPRCDVAACDAAYRSFRASDCTYQPYDGPRRLCTRTSDDDAALDETAASDEEDADDAQAPPAESPPAAVTGQFVCNFDACEEAYRSFRASDCTYQPFEGPRRLCERGQPLVAASIEDADDAAAEPERDEILDEINEAFSAAELEEAEFPPIDPEAVARAEAELDAEETFDAVAAIAAPIGYGLFAAFVLIRLLLLKPAAATAAFAPPAPGTPPRPEDPVERDRRSWRVAGAAFGGQAQRWPEDYGRG